MSVGLVHTPSGRQLARGGKRRRGRMMGRAALYAKVFAFDAIAKRRGQFIIGLTGPSGVGKTEIIKHLMERHGFEAYHVGWPVKRALKEGFDLSRSEVDGKHKNESALNLGGVEPKFVLDHVGEAIARTAPLATALALGRQLDGMRRDKTPCIVIDGVRQQAEADLIHRRGGIVVRVDDGSGPDPKYPMDKRAWRIPADYHLDTSGSLVESKREVDKLLAQCRLERPHLFRKYSPDQPRDGTGRWSAVGGLKGARPSRHAIRQILLQHGQQTGNERAVVQNQKTGRVFLDQGGNETSVSPGSTFPTVWRQAIGHEPTFFHNHPAGKTVRIGANPSGSDVAIALFRGGKHVVYTHTGSVYHYSAKVPRPYSLDATDKASKASQLAHEILPVMALTRPARESSAASAWGTGHGANLALRDAGWINYNFRLSPSDKKLAESNHYRNATERARLLAGKALAGKLPKVNLHLQVNGGPVEPLHKNLGADSVHIAANIGGDDGRKQKRKKGQLSIAYLPPHDDPIVKFDPGESRDSRGRWTQATAQKHLHAHLLRLFNESATVERHRKRTGEKSGDIAHNLATFASVRALGMKPTVRTKWLRQKLKTHGVFLDAGHKFPGRTLDFTKKPQPQRGGAYVSSFSEKVTSSPVTHADRSAKHVQVAEKLEAMAGRHESFSMQRGAAGQPEVAAMYATSAKTFRDQAARHRRLAGESYKVAKINSWVRAMIAKVLIRKGTIEQTMHEYKHGKLHSGSKKGPLVRDRKQAIAIALSQAGLSRG